MNLRIRASGLHLLVSASIASLAGILVFFVWYPSPYGALAGGLSLFTMVVGIDVVLGPALTALIASPAKSVGELRRDIALVVIIQLLAFCYGMYTIAMARPVHLVFEVDRMQVVTAADIDPERLKQALPQHRYISWTGPTLLAARKSLSQAEMMRGLDLGLQGIDISMQPERWVEYALYADAVLQKARPVNLLVEKYPYLAAQMQSTAAANKVTLENMRFLPMTSRQASAVVLIVPPNARIVDYVKVDGFFSN